MDLQLILYRLQLDHEFLIVILQVRHFVWPYLLGPGTYPPTLSLSHAFLGTLSVLLY